VNPDGRCWPRSWRVTRRSSGSASRCSPAISGAVSRAPEPVTYSGRLRPRRGSSSAAAMPAGESKKPSDWRAAIPAASHSSTIPAPPEKRIQAAHAAQSGVAAALLTQAGFSGPVDIIEGSGGFARAYADAWDPAIIESGLGWRSHLMDVLVKSHAAAARVAAAIDGMLALRQQHGFTADDIETIRLGIPRIIAGRLTNAHPVDLQAAQMCLPFSVALAAKIPMPADLVPAVAVADYEAALADR